MLVNGKPPIIHLKPGGVYQTRNNRIVRINASNPRLGILEPLNHNGDGEQYTWREDGSYDQGNPNSIGIPHEWDLVVEIKAPTPA